ncbi:hypothetical protein PIIN_08397 [Serendipita indica DSM 11827]|uniref:Uncharacterized protein n=1 Tax=Serendipita indica (strain DSM 11827) TaxID=1109443 RepID=G4TT01_SERID|nr:hypothetical protein PIIN_08397 [Serendipita indica DSM 11827]
MRSTVNAFAAPLLLGSTLVYAAYIHPDAALQDSVLRKRQDNDGWGELGVVTGTISLTTVRPTNPAAAATNQGSGNPDSTPLPNAAVAATVDSQSHDSATDHATNTDTVHTTSGTLSNFSIFTHSSSPSVASIPTALAPSPGAAESTGVQNRGVLVGIVVGGVVFGCLALTVGLWLCYRRRGPTSGASTPRYTTPVVGDEKSRSPLAFLRKGGNLPWKKGHVRVKSSMSFASPIIGDEPNMVETPSANSRAPLAAHLGGGGGNAGRDTWNGRWSTFSTSDGSAYPQTPVNNTLPLSGVLMETVVESDAPSTPRPAPGPLRTNSEYLQLQRSSNDSVFAIPPAKDQSPHLPPLGATRYSTYREEDATMSPSTPTSSGALTFGSAGHGGPTHYQRMSDRTVTSQPYSSGLYSTTNSSHPGNHSTVLLTTKPKFNPIHHNGSGNVSTRQGSTGSGSGGDGATIRITNPFLDDDDLSSYGHGIVEASSDVDDSRSIQSMESGAFGAYPSSAGCMPLPSNSKHGALSPSPTPDAERSSTSSDTASAPMTRPRSSLISDASSDYPYPMGYAVDPDGNVANPFLRISELLEEVDGRMRWPSPPLLNRSESRNY